MVIRPHTYLLKNSIQSILQTFPKFSFPFGKKKTQHVGTGKGCFLMAFLSRGLKNDRNDPFSDRQRHAPLHRPAACLSVALAASTNISFSCSVLQPPVFSLSFPCPWANKCVNTSLQRPVINVFMEQLGTGQPFDDSLKETAFTFILALTCRHRRKGGGPHSAHFT